jgi:hypothetical protein
MTWREILLVLIRCELKAKYSYLSDWQFSAKGALPIVLLVAAGFIAYLKG